MPSFEMVDIIPKHLPLYVFKIILQYEQSKKRICNSFKSSRTCKTHDYVQENTFQNFNTWARIIIPYLQLI